MHRILLRCIFGLFFTNNLLLTEQGYLPYNVGMRRILLLLLIVSFTLPLFMLGCNNEQYIEPAPPSIESTPPEFEEETEEEQKRKKQYIVSTTNGLRVRTKPSGTASVIGSLDKNDALLLVCTEGNYYKTVFKEKTAYVHSGYCAVLEVEASNDEVEKAIDIGCSLMGYPYVWGSQRYHWGNGKLNKNFVAGKFDCSALVQYIYYHSSKVILDVNTRTQVYNGTEVKKEDLSRGDLMFFTNASRINKKGVERIGHVGIYFGNNYILHTASDHAVIEPISSLRWSYYITARRVV